MTNISYTFYIKNIKTFENIVNKKKRIEGRLNKNNKILSIKNNSYIKFIHYYNNSKYYEINARVIHINIYDNFNNMLLNDNISAIYFTTIEEL